MTKELYSNILTDQKKHTMSGAKKLTMNTFQNLSTNSYEPRRISRPPLRHRRKTPEGKNRACFQKDSKGEACLSQNVYRILRERKNKTLKLLQFFKLMNQEAIRETIPNRLEKWCLTRKEFARMCHISDPTLRDFLLGKIVTDETLGQIIRGISLCGKQYG